MKWIYWIVDSRNISEMRQTDCVVVRHVLSAHVPEG